MLIASTLERWLEEVALGEGVAEVAIADLVVELDAMTIEELTMEEACGVLAAEVVDVAGMGGVGVERAVVEEPTMVETGGVLAAEVADVGGMGGVVVKRAVAAVRNTSLASPLMRVQKSGRRLD